ncbi:hypothetical protein MKW94_001901 [Papaver nudicaule]|uniref:Protein kinase domain-containing protein n=1 Tax=Papaver nudicaule TaxID=74823 RepID=A0AA41VCF8_PAPNU|nr:hypothetical protein [Papaver nudicaule]
MIGEKNGAGQCHRQCISCLSFLFLAFMHLLFLPKLTAAKGGGSSSPSPSSYTPGENYLIDCGSPQATKIDGRTFKSDKQSASLLSTEEDIQISVPVSDINIASSISSSSLPLYLTARVFNGESTYSFFISHTGRHWLRLYFYPLPHPSYNLTSAVFIVTTDEFVLLHDFNVPNQNTSVFKEYIINITSDKFSLRFSPKKNSLAFINAVELVSAPDTLISDSATAVSPLGEFRGLSSYALEVCYRLNVGGATITPTNDTLGRVWFSDEGFLELPESAKSVSVAPSVVKYPESGASPLIAPNFVYATAKEMGDAATVDQSFNLTWEMKVDSTFSYLIRMHFCDIVSKSMNDLYFNVYVNELMGIPSLDLSRLTSALSTAYYNDFVANTSSISNGTLRIQVGPSNTESGTINAILNGLEVMKMSNEAGSLDGLFNVEGTYVDPSKGLSPMKIVSIVGLVIGVLALAFVVMVFCRWRKKPPDWRKSRSFSSWLLPLHVGQSTFMNCKSGSRAAYPAGSNKSKSKSRSKSGYSNFYPPALGLGRVFSFAELQEATKSFDENAVIGVGGFGKVYLGEQVDGTKLAIKRGNASSEQGINEFQTEIQMLSKLRHRHLVSIIGYCDEQSEMILVYEYMANGPLRDHLYGSDLPPLSWKQRLEICIGAARGLHYLHTGAAQGIIHRDVKTTNILLDENLVAKVSDFGLSKAAPTLEQTHVSTAVKGSFGYLDPEYFRSQKLTEKSDVYSFGVVLLEVLCVRPAISTALPREQVNLAEWAMQWHRKGLIAKIIDPLIAESINTASLKKYIEAAEKCLEDYGVDRPSMGDVLWNLEYALQLQESSSRPSHTVDENISKVIIVEEEDTSTPPVPDDAGDIELTAEPPVFSQISNFQGR